MSTPTLMGRLQTRVVLMAVIGIVWTVLLAPVAFDSRLDGLAALGVLTGLGLLWEVVYQALQQCRADKDWPSSFGLAGFVPEAALAWPVLGVLGLAPHSVPSYLGFFGGLSLIVWLVKQGPMRVFAPRWRYAGARIFARSYLRPLEEAPKAPAPKERVTSSRRLRAVPVGLGVIALASAGVGAYGFLDSPDQNPKPASQTQDAAAAMDIPTTTSEKPKGATKWDKKKHVEPAGLSIPKIKAKSTLKPIGLRPDKTLDLPSDVARAGWYKLGVAPGELGPSVLVGHVDSKGVFSRLAELKKGDQIAVKRDDGSTVNFDVDRVREVSTEDFPTKDVYGYVNKPALRVVGTDVEAQRDVIVEATAKTLSKEQ